jgi:acetoin utilization deacetylase AcuC-like enzyme
MKPESLIPLRGMKTVLALKRRAISHAQRRVKRTRTNSGRADRRKRWIGPNRWVGLDRHRSAGIEMYARRSARAAIETARTALCGEPAVSLMRPPGHHATRDRAMGFCYFSNVAIATLDALQNGTERVAIWDFDGHHGNGTEAIVAHNARIRFASVHQFPAYPGTGAKSFANIDNYPVAPFTPRNEIGKIAERSLEKLITFKPDLVLVSAGFDAYVRDPLLQLTLEGDDFAEFGQRLSKINVPVAVALEGGYSNELPELVDAFLTAWNKRQC